MPPTSLLDLSAELRNIIYELSVVNQSPLYAASPVGCEDTFLRNAKEPGLLRVNRQIRVEAFYVFWSRNTFYSYHRFQLGHWLSQLSDNQICALTPLRTVQPVEGDRSHRGQQEAVYCIAKTYALCFVRKYGRGLLAKSAIGMATTLNGKEIWVSAEGNEVIGINKEDLENL